MRKPWFTSGCCAKEKKIVLEKIIKNTETNPNGIIFNRRQYRAYAGNVLILERSVQATDEVVTKLTEAALSTGLETNKNKTKNVKINRHVTNLGQDLLTDGQVLEGVQSFRYLRTFINSKNIISEDITPSTAADNRCF
jgi:hypothetical protein